jgi:hypothetical protein
MASNELMKSVYIHSRVTSAHSPPKIPHNEFDRHVVTINEALYLLTRNMIPIPNWKCIPLMGRAWELLVIIVPLRPAFVTRGGKWYLKAVAHCLH